MAAMRLTEWRLYAALLLLVALSPTEGLVVAPGAARGRAAALQLGRRPRLAAGIYAQEGDDGGGGGERERSRGRTAVVSRPKPKPKNENREDVDKDKSWRVLLHNDDVHTFDYVTMAVVKVVKTITRKKAHRITVQCHSMGTATVTTTWKQMAKQMCLKLQKFGLTSSIAPD